MSSDILARVETFAAKAGELSDKGHLLRAEENYGRAAEAARALGADNLAALHMQLRQSDMLLVFFSSAPNAGDPVAYTAHRAQFIALLSGAVEALERRRGADTLLEGKCAAVEEAWRARRLQIDIESMPAAKAASLAALCGYEQFLSAAVSALAALTWSRMFAAECADAQLQSFARHVVHAAELMQLPQRVNNSGWDMEVTFVKALRDAVAKARPNGLDARLVHLLTDAWQRLERSDVLQTRNIEVGNQSPTPENHVGTWASITRAQKRNAKQSRCTDA